MYTLLTRNPNNPATFGQIFTVDVSTGIADAGKVVITGVDGKIDPSLVVGGSGTSGSLQGAYNGGTNITITNALGPVSFKGYDTLNTVFVVRDSSNADIARINADRTTEFTGSVEAPIFTSNFSATVNTNSPNIIIDSLAIAVYRAVQYTYSIRNSDNSGYETGQIYLIHDGTNVNIFQTVGCAIGVACGTSFDSIISVGNLSLRVTTDNSGAFSRIIQLFRISLPV